MKTLAFLIDEIDKSKELIRYAALFAKDINARVHVLYVQNSVNYGTYDHVGMASLPDLKVTDKTADENNKKVEEIIKELIAKDIGFSSIEFKSDIGEASIILKEKVENNEYDLLMLQGSSEESFWMNNSVIMNIVRNVPCPVFIIPPDTAYQPLKKIIYATDHNEEDISTLKSLIDLAKPFNPEILALHVSNDDEFEEKLKSKGFAEMLNEKTGSNNISVKMIPDMEGADAVESLVNEAEKAKANIIVVLKENRNFFERIFKSSFTADLIKKVQLPVLVFHIAK